MAKTQTAASGPEVKTETDEVVVETEAQAKETAQVESAAPAPKFSIARLRKDCLNLFGVTYSTFDGATFGLTGEYTVEEMRGRIKTWQDGSIPVDKTEKEVN